VIRRVAARIAVAALVVGLYVGFITVAAWWLGKLGAKW
jgi:hypothetical protein